MNVNAYKEFKDTHYIGLVGRTGTGKTSIIRKLTDDIRNEESECFSYVVELSLKDYLLEIPNYTSINSSIQSMAEVEKNIELYIKLCVMKYIVSNKELFLKDKFGENNIKIIENYLSTKGIKRETDIVRKILNTLSEMKYDTSLSTAVSAISKITLSLTGEDYDKAVESLSAILMEAPILVIIDTLEHYDIRDEQLLIIARALITVSFHYAWNFHKENMFIKYAMPSEIYTQVRSLLPAKFVGREIYIEWNYKDLVKMVAIKFYCYAINHKDFFDFISNYSLDDLYEDAQTAMNLIYEFLPEMCPATIALKFDTMAYCIRHTQKKPRQLLMVMDALIGYIVERNNKNLLKMNTNKVRYLIHSVQEEMIMDSISMYRDSIPQLLKIFSEIISGKQYKFCAKELEEYIRGAKTLYREKLRAEDIKRVLIESGIIGLQEKEKYIPENSKWFENEKVIRVMDASFEYQIKGNLIYNENSIMLIHPMCYEYFKCEISKYTMVYPDREVDPDDFLNNIFKDDNDYLFDY